MFYDKENFVDGFQDALKELPCHCGEGLIITYSFQEKSVEKYDAAMFTIPYLKFLFMVCNSSTSFFMTRN